MANANILIPFILRWEGGFACIPGDRGGATNKGVTLATFRSVFGANKTVQDLKNMTDSEWRHIFLSLFWDKFFADQITSQKVANACVDWAWHSGTSNVAKRIQRLLGVKTDGIVGMVTLEAINNAGDALFKKIEVARKKYLNALALSKPSQKKFLKGWMNRVNALNEL
ncbi:MAG: glycoside hydrolase family 108 protein [Alloprevotella sp.]